MSHVPEGTRFTWGLSDVRSDYAGTTQLMKRLFPHLASVPTEDASMHR